MKIVNKYPPNYDEIIQHFPVKNKRGIIFTYGDKLYVPAMGTIPHIPDHLMAHEKTHSKQQKNHKGGVKGWWKQYFEDKQFRLDQESEAYRNQYNHAKETLNRKECRLILKKIAKDLSSKIYGNLVSKLTARVLITGKKI